MMINRSNYESYLVDYLDGNLNPALVPEMEIFLENYPELRSQIEDFSPFPLKSSSANCKFPNKSDLKKSYDEVSVLDALNFDEFCIASYEGLLNNLSRQRLHDYLQKHPESQWDYQLLGKTLLIPDPSVKCPEKSILKKHIIKKQGVLNNFHALSIAASVALLALLWWMFPREKMQPVEILSLTETLEYPPSEINAKAMISLSPHEIMQQEENRIPDIKEKDARIADMQPDIPSLLNPVHVSSLYFQAPELPLITMTNKNNTDPGPKIMPIDSASPENEDNALTFILRKINLVKTAETVVKGFNYLTESEFQLTSTTNSQGQLTQMEINAGIFSIASNRKN